MPEQPQSPAPTAIHTRLEHMEECVDAANFLSLLATGIFFGQGLFNLILLPHGGAIARAEWIVEALIALAAVWILYQFRTRLVLAAIILFVLVFSLIMCVSTYLSMTSELKLEAVPSFAIAYLTVLLGYADYRLVSAAWSVSRISEAERLIVRGKGSPTIQGFLLQLFGIPTICEWLNAPQRRISVALFFLSMSAFCFFVVYALTVLIGFVPEIEILSLEAMTEGGFSLALKFSLTVLALYPAILGLVILLVAGLRFAARRVTRLSLERLVSSDTRPPILFLRSFRDDQVRLRKPRRSLFHRIVSVGEPRPTLDHVLLEEATPYGPVVAIGKPGATPPFGAARKYVTDAEWRETVAELCRHAAAVAITIDETEGVRWELQHLLGQNHVGKTLFLLPPQLAAPAEVLRVLPTAFADWREHGVWIEQIRAMAAPEGRCCIGWFWRVDGRLEVLTSLHNSSSAYLLAVRSFLNQEPAPAVAPSLLPSEADVQIGGHEERRRQRQTYLGGGIMIAIAGVALGMLILNLPYGILVLPAVFISLAWWGLSHTRLARALVPTLGIALGHWVWMLLVLVVSVGVGTFSAQSWSNVIHLVAFLGFIVWVIAAQSLGATVALLIFESMFFLTTFESFAVQSGLSLAIQAAMRACEVAASIYAILKLNAATAAPR